MSVESQIYTILSSTAGVTGVVAKRIYPIVVPEGTAMPCVTYFKVSDVPEHAMGVDVSVRTVRMQISCWGTTYSSVKAVEAAVRTALSRSRNGVQDIFIDSILDLYEDDTQIYQVAIDIIVFYS